MTPTLVAARTALPPEGALRLRPDKAGSAAPAGVEAMPPRLSLLVLRCSPRGRQRLRSGKAGSAAPAGVEAMPPRLSLRVLRCPTGGAATPAAHAGMCVVWVWDGRLIWVVMLSVPLRPFS